jgi:Ca2+-binding EF-hand superfamily protein
MDKESDEESRKLFRYIDYNNDGVIDKVRIKHFIVYLQDEFKSK